MLGLQRARSRNIQHKQIQRRRVSFAERGVPISVGYVDPLQSSINLGWKPAGWTFAGGDPKAAAAALDRPQALARLMKIGINCYGLFGFGLNRLSGS